MNNKIFIQDIPVFNSFEYSRDNFQITPFVHFNTLWMGDTKKYHTSKQEATSIYNPLHLSAGFGVNLLTSSVSIELYYNAFVKKNSYDIGSELSISFGID